MVKFGKLFREIQIEDYKGYYFGYKSLKQFIREKKKSFDDPNAKPERIEELCNTTVQEFYEKLNKEIKFYRCFSKNEGEIYEKINQHLHIQNVYNSMSEKQIAKEYKELNDISESALKLLIFITYNIRALRKILKKFDKKFEVSVTNNYISSKIDSIYGLDLLYVFRFKKLDQTMALILSLEKNLDEGLLYKNNTIENFSFGNNQLDMNSLSVKTEESFIIQDSEINDVINREKQNIKKRIEQTNQIIKDFKIQFKDWITYLKTLKDNINLSILSEQGRNSKTYSNDSMNLVIFNKRDSYAGSTTINEQQISNKISALELIGKINKDNIYLIYFHSFNSGLAYYIILPNFINNFSLLAKSSKYWILCCIPIYIIVPLVHLIKLLKPKSLSAFLIKTQFLFSAMFLFMGNLLYAYGNNLKTFYNLLLMILGRLILGIAISQSFGKNYIIEYIPHTMIGKSMINIKNLTLIGNAIGPLLCVIFSKIIFSFKTKDINYSIPSLICGMVSFIELLLVCCKFTDPSEENFELFIGESFDVWNQRKDKNKKRSFVSLYQDINNVKEERHLSEGELVNGKISEIVWTEMNSNNILNKSFLLIRILAFASNFLVAFNLLFIILFFITNNPLKKEEKDYIFYASIILFGTLVIVVMIYDLYSKKIRKVYLDKNLIILFLIIILSLEIGTLLCLIKNNKNNDWDNLKIIMLIIFICILTIFSHLLLISSLHLFSKLIPYHKNFPSDTKVNFSLKIGEICGCIVVFLLKIAYEPCLFIIPVGILILSIFFYHRGKILKETSLTRVLKENAERKFKFGEI